MFAMGKLSLLQALDDNRDDILRFLIARTGNRDDAEDLLSDLFLKIDQFAGADGIDNPRAYLFTTVNRMVLDRLRATRRRSARERAWVEDRVNPECLERDEYPTPEEEAIAADENARVQKAIGKLPAGARRVLVLHKIDGVGHADIANRLGISRSAVEKHMAVAMRHLRKLLGELR